MSYSKRNNFIKKFYKNCSKKLVPGPFLLGQNQAQPLFENEIFEGIYLYQVYNSKAIKISPNQHAGLLRILFTEDSLKIEKDLKLVSRPQYSQNFSIKNFILKLYINWPNFTTRLCLLPKFFYKMCFVFHAYAFEDVMTFEYLKI